MYRKAILVFIKIMEATIVKTPKPAKEEKDEHLPCCAVCGVRQRPENRRNYYTNIGRYVADQVFVHETEFSLVIVCWTLCYTELDSERWCATVF